MAEDDEREDHERDDHERHDDERHDDERHDDERHDDERAEPERRERTPGAPARGDGSAAAEGDAIEEERRSSRDPDPSEPSAKQSGATVEQRAAEVATYTPSYVFLFVVTLVNLVADLWSKAWAKGYFESLRPGDPRRLVIWEDRMNFIFAKNRGGAWGLLQNETEALRRPFFLIVSVAAIVFIVSLYRKLQPGQGALKWGLPLVLGGALGNLVDRIRYGYVVDFIDVYMQMDGKPKHWPTFNVADISICVGVGLMAIDMFTSRETDKAKDKVTTLPGSDDADPPSARRDTDEGEPQPKADGAAGGV